MLPTLRGSKDGGSLLVMGSANVDEQLRGYYTKHDCSSADLTPIGGVSKTDLTRFILWAQTNFDLSILAEFLTAVPTAELFPFTDTYIQSDAEEMRLAYEQLSILGRLRKVSKLGPFGAWEKSLYEWQGEGLLRRMKYMKKLRPSSCPMGSIGTRRLMLHRHVMRSNAVLTIINLTNDPSCIRTWLGLTRRLRMR